MHPIKNDHIYTHTHPISTFLPLKLPRYSPKHILLNIKAFVFLLNNPLSSVSAVHMCMMWDRAREANCGHIFQNV